MHDTLIQANQIALFWSRACDQATRDKSRVANGNVAVVGDDKNFEQRSWANSRMRLRFDIVNLPESAKDIPTLTRGTAKSSMNAQSSHAITNGSWKSLSRE